MIKAKKYEQEQAKKKENMKRFQYNKVAAWQYF